MRLPEIPRSWLIAGLGLSLVILRYFGIDSWTTAGLGMVIGYLTGVHLPQQVETPTTNASISDLPI